MTRSVRKRTEKYSLRVSVVIIAVLAALSWLAVYELAALIWRLLGWAWL